MTTKYSRDYPQEALFGGLPGNFKFNLPRINNKKKLWNYDIYRKYNLRIHSNFYNKPEEKGGGDGLSLIRVSSSRFVLF
jgi:hypothetical protein